MEYQVANFKQKYEGFRISTSIDEEKEPVLVVHTMHPISQKIKYVAVSAESAANKRGFISARVIHNLARQVVASFKPEEELANIPIPEEGEDTCLTR